MTNPKNTPQHDLGYSTGFDALLPAEMAHKAEEVGLKKAEMDALSIFALAVLAGAFIALGAVYATVAWTTGGQPIHYGLNRIIGGVVFSLGVILVIVGGAELFTGNTLIVIAWASRKLSTMKLLRNWVIVYLGNLVGALATAGLVFFSRHFMMGKGGIGVTALNIGLNKVELDFLQALVLGILCNALVCLAVWLSFSARSTTDKILAVIFPISAFVAAGFEHSIANMYFIPLAIFIKHGAPEVFWQVSGADFTAYQALDWGSFLINNLLPVTIGNIVGGALMVGGVYWLIYRRKERIPN